VSLVALGADAVVVAFKFGFAVRTIEQDGYCDSGDKQENNGDSFLHGETSFLIFYIHYTKKLKKSQVIFSGTGLIYKGI
jgi:hypothetical protein